MWHTTCETCHITHDTWQMTYFFLFFFILLFVFLFAHFKRFSVSSMICWLIVQSDWPFESIFLNLYAKNVLRKKTLVLFFVVSNLKLLGLIFFCCSIFNNNKKIITKLVWFPLNWPHLADSVIKSPWPSVWMSVCLCYWMYFFSEATHRPWDHMIRSRPFIGLASLPPPPQLVVPPQILFDWKEEKNIPYLVGIFTIFLLQNKKNIYISKKNYGYGATIPLVKRFSVSRKRDFPKVPKILGGRGGPTRLGKYPN